MVRLKFNNDNGVYSLKEPVVSQDGSLLTGLVTKTTEGFVFSIKNVNDHTYIIHQVADTLPKAKKHLKIELQNLGVHFDKEVRNRVVVPTEVTK